MLHTADRFAAVIVVVNIAVFIVIIHYASYNQYANYEQPNGATTTLKMDLRR